MSCVLLKELNKKGFEKEASSPEDFRQQISQARRFKLTMPIPIPKPIRESVQ